MTLPNSTLALKRDNVSNFEIGLTEGICGKVDHCGQLGSKSALLYLQVLFNALLKPLGWFLILGLDW
jgi:hypothetical protein